MGAHHVKINDIVWPAVLAVLLICASVISGVLSAPANIWAPLGLAGIGAALLAQRADK